ncbi:MAG: hypothetical protein C0598_08740 [Marinilabiliales bacterium]|nr:MAG: hypothetical protein C0598_08740 [Marinilabiliales bacterium]
MKNIIFSLKISRILYILLLIATPFLLLQNYLQSAIGKLSDYTFKIASLDIPLTLSVVFFIVIVVLTFSWKKINLLRSLSWVAVILLFWIGQKTTDFYFNHKFYELQYNWHYFAYSIFAFINYHYLKEKNRPDYKIILLTFISALEISTLDEFLQIPLSNRIFDLGDVAKDLWGTLIGLFFIYFILENGKIFKNKWRFRQKKIKEYLKSPVALFVFLFIISYIFMLVSSVLTDTEYLIQAIMITLFLSIAILSLIHLTQFSRAKYFIIVIFGLAFTLLIFSFIKNYDKNISYSKNSILIYKGIPIVYFDVIIYPNGMFRIVDKKTSFNMRDQQTIWANSENIIVVASGQEGKGAKGLRSSNEIHFEFDKTKGRGIQIIPQKNSDAVKTFNRLKSDSKRPLLIYNNN